MPRQIAPGVGDPSISLLEERIRRLETQVALLTHAVQALTRELTEHESTGPGGEESPDPGPSYMRRQRASQKQ